MSQSALDYWNRVYTENPFRFGKAPLTFLQNSLNRLQKGKVLDVAMGEGVNSVYLAQKGMKVTGFDISPVAVEHAHNLAKESGVTIDAKVCNLDFYLWNLMEFDSIIMTFFKPSIPRYYSEMIRSLKQGGTLLIHSYGTEEMTQALSQDEAFKDYYFKANEILHQLKGMHILYYNEDKQDGRNIIQCLALKPLDKHVAKFNLFDMQSADSKPKSGHLKNAEELFKKK